MATLASGLSDSISDDEDLARFLTQSSQFTTTLVKPAAFLPNPKDHQTSVSRHGPEPRADFVDAGIIGSRHQNPACGSYLQSANGKSRTTGGRGR